MHSNANALFATINRAYDQKSSTLNLSSRNVTAKSIKHFQSIWSSGRFYCTRTEVIGRVLESKYGYEVRHIPVYFDSGKTDNDKYQEIVLEFDNNGMISDVYSPVGQHQYKKISEGLMTVENTRQRLVVFDFVQQVLSAYLKRDIEYLEKVYSDDALIITGKVLGYADGIPKIKYTTQDKETYLSKLQNIFKNNEYLHVDYKDIVVTQSEEYPEVFGILCRQIWKTGSPKKGYYQDEGYLFYTIDFKNEDQPLIKVRTWQPLFDAKGKPIHYTVDRISSLSQFPLR
jgi:hypothetical protein